MKIFKSVILLSLMTGFILSCSNAPKGDKAETGEKAPVKEAPAAAKTMNVNTGTSVIKWTGSKVAGNHTGTLKLSDGKVMVADGKVTGGKFTIDMGSLANTDMPAAEGGDDLVAHLASADFFDVANNPTSSFEITKVVDYNGDDGANSMVYGNLTLMGVTKEVGFKANINASDSGVNVTTPDFTIDRTDFGLKYGSAKFFDDLKDKAINDKIGLSLNINT